LSYTEIRRIRYCHLSRMPVKTFPTCLHTRSTLLPVQTFMNTSPILSASARFSLVGMILLSLGAQKAFSAESATSSLTEIHAAAGTNLAVNASADDYVMNLTDFVAEEGSKVTLKGKRGSKVVINISGNFDISGAKIVLGGGLLPSDVVFNLTGIGSTLVRQISGNSIFFGNLQVVGSQVTVSDSSVNGRRIRGVTQMGVQSGATTARIKPPPKPRGPVSP
jgi:hypothetical protein